MVLTASPGEDLPNVVRLPHRTFSGPLRSFLGLERDSYGAIARLLRTFRRLVSEVKPNPEPESGWRRPATAEGVRQLGTRHFDAIVSTSPPATAHLVARDLKELTGLPWIADFRDLWSDNYSYAWSKLRRAVDRRIERKTLHGATALSSVSEPLAHSLRSHLPPRSWSIANGFSLDELAPSEPHVTDRFTITYTGSLYPGKRDPKPSLEALSGLVAEGAIAPKDLELRFFGRNVNEPTLGASISAYGLSESVTLGGLIPRHEALERQRESQILLALDWMDTHEPGVYTGKIFEYLAAQRPILSTGLGGSVVERLLGETSAGQHCTTLAAVKDFLLKSYGEFRRSGQVAYHGDLEAIQRYSHTSMAARFAALLSKVVLGQTAGHGRAGSLPSSNS